MHPYSRAGLKEIWLIWLNWAQYLEKLCTGMVNRASAAGTSPCSWCFSMKSFVLRSCKGEYSELQCCYCTLLLHSLPWVWLVWNPIPKQLVMLLLGSSPLCLYWWVGGPLGKEYLAKVFCFGWTCQRWTCLQCSAMAPLEWNCPPQLQCNRSSRF